MSIDQDQPPSMDFVCPDDKGDSIAVGEISNSLPAAQLDKADAESQSQDQGTSKDYVIEFNDKATPTSAPAPAPIAAEANTSSSA